MSYHKCQLCGSDVVEIYCSKCLWDMQQDTREGRLPHGVLPKYFGLHDWQAYRLTERALAEGKISQVEAEQKAATLTAQILERQCKAIAAEEAARMKEQKSKANYLY